MATSNVTDEDIRLAILSMDVYWRESTDWAKIELTGNILAGYVYQGDNTSGEFDDLVGGLD